MSTITVRKLASMSESDLRTYLESHNVTHWGMRVTWVYAYLPGVEADPKKAEYAVVANQFHWRSKTKPTTRLKVK